MKRLAIAVAIAMSLAACGSSSNGSITNPGAAAAAKTFTYGSAGSATSLQTSALTSQVSGLVGAQGSISSGSAQAAADFSSTTDTILGGYSTPISAAFPQGQSALTAADGRISRILGTDSATFDNQGCIKQGTDRVDFDGCTVSGNDSSGSFKASVNGYFQASATAANWSLTIDVTASGSANGQSGSVDGHYATSGDVKTSTSNSVVTVNGDLREELAMSWDINGQSGAFDLSEQLLLTDITYDQTQGCVTSGTLEAKRVWVKKPSDQTQLTDKAAKVTWQGCGTGSIMFSTN